MSNANRILLWLLGIALLAGVLSYGYWFASNFERHSKEVRTTVSPEARKNRFLAAERFLHQSGQSVQSHAGRDIFTLAPDTGDTILLGSNSHLFLQRNHDALMEWVKAGGHLLLVPRIYDEEDEEEEKDPLLEQLGVELIQLDEDEEDDKQEEQEVEESQCALDDNACDDIASSRVSEAENSDEEDSAEHRDKRVTVTFKASHPGEFKARFLADRYLYDAEETAEVVVGVDDMPNLLRFSLGSGAVTVLSDMDLFTNDFIGEYDHAYLFARLVNTPGKVWIFYSADMPSLLVLLWQRMPWLSLISVVLLLLAGWRMTLNSGPRLKPPYDPRRNLIEHLDAAANYSWRIDKARQLVADNRTAVEHAWRRRHPQLNSMDRRECCEWIGEKTGISASAIERTLYGEITSEQDFIRATSVMQRLATRVTKHADSASTNRS